MKRSPIINHDAGILEDSEKETQASEQEMSRVFGTDFPIRWLVGVTVSGWIFTLFYMPIQT